MLTRKLTTFLATIGAFTLTATAAYAATTVEGIDTSHYQHAPTLDWAKVRADGVSFAFMKATEGSTFKDPYFTSDWAATAANGIYRGAYHFARPSTGTAKKQARFFASVIGPQTGRGTLPPVLDLEATGGLTKSKLVAWTSAFLVELERLTQRVPIIYVSPAFWESWLGNSTAFTRYPLWIAHYTNIAPRVPGGWPSWTFWQTSSSGKVKGISGRVDTDLFNGDLMGLKRLALDAGPLSTSLTISPSVTAPRSGRPVSFTGQLLDSSGAPLAGRPLVLQRAPEGSAAWTDVAALATLADGTFTASTTVTAPGSYRVAYAGENGFLATASTPAPITLTATPTTIVMTASATAAVAGQPVTFTGRLKPAKRLAGRTIDIQVQTPGSTAWTPVGTATSDANGYFTAALPVVSSGLYAASFAGDAGYTSSASPTTELAVTINTTSLSLTASNLAPYEKAKVTMAGALVSGTSPVAGRVVTIMRALAGSTEFTPVGTATTNADGSFATRIEVDAAASYQAVFAADPVYAASTSLMQSLTITPPVRTRLRAHLDRNQALRGKLVTEAGTPIAGRGVQVWKRVGKTWVKVDRVITRKTGAWKVRVPAGSQYKVRFVGGPRFRSAHSGAVRL